MMYDSLFESALQRGDMKEINLKLDSIHKHIMIGNMKKLGYQRDDCEALFRRGGFIFDEADDFADKYYNEVYDYMLKRIHEVGLE